jgi:filamentous hemagglutinin
MNNRAKKQSSQGLGLKLFTAWISLALAAQPLPLYAAGVEVDGGGAELTEAANGVPVIDIAAPSAAGVSHNRFTQFNVDSRGLILNNSASVSQSQLGGAVNANSNLRAGREASLILNEVTAANRSQLRGYTEIVGRSAEYILANPYGITCNGCGFINTPQVTLTTGVPQMQGGALQGLSVNGGDILVEGLGLNAINVDHFSIITRAARLNSEFYAADLELILGRNDIDMASGVVTPKTDLSNGKPQFALDASALGAMYAGRITLIGTEAGVGVRMAGDMAADSGDIILTADGNFSLAKVQSNENIAIESVNGGITFNDLSYAVGTTMLDAAGLVRLNDLTAAQGNVNIRAGVLEQHGTLVAGLNADYSINGAADLELDIDDSFSNDGMVFAGDHFDIDAGTVINTSWLKSFKDLRLRSDSVANTGFLEALNDLNVTTDSLYNRDRGEIIAHHDLHAQVDTLVNADAIIDVGNIFNILAVDIDNTGGTITGAGTAESRIVADGKLNNRSGGLIQSNAADLRVLAAELNNDHGQILHAGTGVLTLGAQAPAAGNTLSNRDGVILGNGAMILNGVSLDNRGGSVSAEGVLDIELAGVFDNGVSAASGFGGWLESLQSINLSAGSVYNAGGIISGIGTDPATQMILDVEDTLVNTGGIIQGGTTEFTISSGDLDNSAGGRILHAGSGMLNIDSAGTLSNSGVSLLKMGTIATAGGLVLNADRIANNEYGLLSADGDLELTTVSGIDNNSGRIDTGGSLAIDAGNGDFDNRGGLVAAEGVADSLITAEGNIDNKGGSIQFNAQNLNLRGADIYNRNGEIAHAGSGALTLEADVIDNAGGSIESAGNFTAAGFNILNNTALNGVAGFLLGDRLNLNGGSLNNTGGDIFALGSAPNAIRLSGALINSSGNIYSMHNLMLDVAGLTNSGGHIQSEADLTMTVPAFNPNQAGSVLNAGNHLTLNLYSNFTLNAGNEFIVDNRLTINTDGTVTNAGNLSAGGMVGLNAGSLINNGVISAGDDLTADITGALVNNTGARLSSAASLSLDVASIINRGTIAAAADLAVTTSGNVDNYNLLFAGDSSRLYVADQFNNYTDASVFAVNDIVIAANSGRGRNSRILNQSGDIEAFNGDISLHTNQLLNQRQTFQVDSGGNVIADTGAANILAGNNILIDAGSVLNDISQIAANGNITIAADGVENRARVVFQPPFTTQVIDSLDGITNRVGTSFSLTSDTIFNIQERIRLHQFNDEILLWVTYATTDNEPDVGTIYVYDFNLVKIEADRVGVNSVVVAGPAAGGGLTDAQQNELLNGGFPEMSDVPGFFMRSTAVSWTNTAHFMDNNGVMAPEIKASLIEAGGNLVVNAGSLINSSYDEDLAGGAGNANISSRFATTSFDERPLSAAATGEGPAQVDHTLLDVTLNPSGNNVTGYVFNPAAGLILPDSGGLFVANPNPDHPYLIETDPDLLDLDFFDQDGGMLGTGQLLAQLPVSPDVTTRRLGDAFYESRLVREAVFETTGRRYLDKGISSDYEQMQYLMNNAIAAQDELNLALGVALSAEQVARLTHDILWLVEQQVQGHKVLVPIYYAAVLRPGDLRPDAMLVAGNVDISLGEGGVVNAGRIAGNESLNLSSMGDVLNAGVLSGRKELSLNTAGNLHNRRGAIIGGPEGGLSLVAGKGVENNKAIIRGGEISLLARENDIRNEAGSIDGGKVLLIARRDIRNEQGSIQADSALLLAEQGDIRNQDATIDGGALSLQANRDLVNERSSIRGGDLTLYAENGGLRQRQGTIEATQDLELSVQQDLSLNSKTDTLSAGRDMSLTSTEGNIVIGNQNRKSKRYELSVAGDLELNAGKNLDIYDSELKAGESLSLAGEDVNLHARRIESSSSDREGRDQGERRQVKHRVIELQAGGDIRISANDDIVSEAAKLEAGSDIALNAKEDIDLRAVHNEDYHYEKHVKKQSMGRKKTTIQEDYTVTAQGAELNAAGDVRINVDENGNSLDSGSVTFEGSRIKAGGDVLLAADEDIDVYAAKTYEFHRLETHKKRAMGLKSESRGDIRQQQGLEKSTLKATENLGVLSGNNITVVASELEADGDVNLQARNDVLIAAGEAIEQSENWHTKSGIDLDISDNMLSVASKERNRKTRVDVYNADSTVSAGGNLRIGGGNDISIVGSVATSGDAINLDAGRNVNILAGLEEHVSRESHKKTRTGISAEYDKNGLEAFAGHDSNEMIETISSSLSVASTVQAGGNLSIRSGQDINQIGSDLIAGNDADMVADRRLNLLSAEDLASITQTHIHERHGLTLRVNHNLGDAREAIHDVGEGDNRVSNASKLLRAVDALSNIGPSASAHLGVTREEEQVGQDTRHARGSTLIAGRDIRLESEERVILEGAQIGAGRDVRIESSDIDILAAYSSSEGRQSSEYRQTGVSLQASRTNASITLGFSRADSDLNTDQIHATGTLLSAGQDLSLTADSNIQLQGTQAEVGRDINLDAGNDILITSAQGRYSSNLDESHLSAAGGFAVGSGGIGYTGSLAAGQNDLERQGMQHTNAQLMAGDTLNIRSGRDTAVTGATLEAEHVEMDVGRNLTVASLQDTGNVEGERRDASVSATVGMGGSFGVNAGSGETEGSTAWVNQQTRIIGRESVDIRVEDHTQLDGALIGTDNGNLILDTGTLAYRDIKDHDNEKSEYLSAGFSTGGTAQANQNTPAREDATGSSWSLEGTYYERDRDQINRATLGEGDIIVRNAPGQDISDLNRDIDQAQEITNDEENGYDLYVSSTALNSLGNLAIMDDPATPEDESRQNTLIQLKENIMNFAKDTNQAYLNMGALGEEDVLPEVVQETAEFINDTGNWVGVLSGGIAPGVENRGGIFGAAAATATGDQYFYRVKTELVFNPQTGEMELKGFKNLGEVSRPENGDYVFTNGIQNTLEEAARNGAMQTGASEFVLAYNPEHGLVGDFILESGWDKFMGGILPSGNARMLNNFYQAGIERSHTVNIAAHSQGGLLNYRAINGLDFTKEGQIPQAGTILLSGAPVESNDFYLAARNSGFLVTRSPDSNRAIFQANHPQGETSLLGYPMVDPISDMPFIGGGNYSSNANSGALLGSFLSLPFSGSDRSPHTNYLCQGVTCAQSPNQPALNEFRSFLRTPDTDGRGYITPTIIEPPPEPDKNNDDPL